MANLPSGGTQTCISGISLWKKQLVMWKLQRIMRVVRSSLGADTIFCVECVEAALVCQKLLLELKGLKVPIVVIRDNKSLVDTV